MTIARLFVALFLLAAASLAQALDIKPYSPALLAEAEQAGRPVALHFRADWCPTCRAQDKVLEGLKADPALKLTVLAVDYDHEKALKKQFSIRSQSTLVVLKGTKETGRLVGDTSVEGLRSALRSAL